MLVHAYMLVMFTASIAKDNGKKKSNLSQILL